MHALCIHIITVFVADFSDEMPLDELGNFGVPANILGVCIHERC